MAPLDLELEALLDDQGVLKVDTTCRNCGYNLRGLHHEHHCPECGIAVGLSLAGDRLRYAEPKWVATVARGVSIIFWMMILAIICGILGVCVGTVGAATGRSGANAGVKLLASAVNTLLTCISIYGVWLMTSRDPSGIGDDPYITSRKIVRFALICGVLGQLLSLFTELGSPPPGFSTIVGLSAGLLGLVALVGEFYKYTYYEILCRRIPNGALAGRARWIKWGYVITLGIAITGGAAASIVFRPMFRAAAAAAAASAPATPAATVTVSPLGASTGPGSMMFTGVFICTVLVVGISWIVFFIATLVLLYGMKRELRLAAKDADLLLRPLNIEQVYPAA